MVQKWLKCDVLPGKYKDERVVQTLVSRTNRLSTIRRRYVVSAAVLSHSYNGRRPVDMVCVTVLQEISGISLVRIPNDCRSTVWVETDLLEDNPCP